MDAGLDNLYLFVPKRTDRMINVEGSCLDVEQKIPLRTARRRDEKTFLVDSTIIFPPRFSHSGRPKIFSHSSGAPGQTTSVSSHQ